MLTDGWHWSAIKLGILAALLAPFAAVQANTRTPIKHLIVVVGENRSFDNVFGTYVPPDRGQTVWNLLSLGIVDQDGHPGPNASLAMQMKASGTGTFQIAPPVTGAFAFLPQPSTTLSAYPLAPCALSQLYSSLGRNPAGSSWCSDIGLEPQAQIRLSQGGSGQGFFDPPTFLPAPDCRYPANLPNGPFAIVGASVLTNCPPPTFKPAITPTKVTDNAGDPAHRFFLMWQQNDCDAAAISPENPSGCRHDLYVWGETSVGWQITADGKPPTDDQGTFQGGATMGFYNMARGDFPFFRSLAHRYAINDNYHQPIMGGTGANSQALLTGDVFYFTDANGNPAPPPAGLVENPDPQPGSNNFYTHASPGFGDLGNTSSGGLVACADRTQPGVAAIQDYIHALPYKPWNDGNCAPNHAYQVDNEYPSYDHLGNLVQTSSEFPAGPDFAIGPQVIPTIGDSLSAKHVSWRYYGEGFDAAADPPIASLLYCAICNAFQYSRSIMTGPLKDNLKDLPDFFSDVANRTLPAVSFIKPNTLLDGHPGTSTPPLFEAFVQRIIDTVMSDQQLWEDTAILITFDESGATYDSGYIQPIDFFGDGPRTVMIAVSPFARRGHIDHTYSDHVSILKFIEYNWGLPPLSARSRDNLPNPKATHDAPYFPQNSPAIGDLTELFRFGHADH